MQFLIFVLCLFPLIGFAKKVDPRVAVQEIQDRSAGGSDSCSFYSIWSSPGGAVREILTDELMKSDGITLVERESISNIYENEINHKNLASPSVVKKKKFIAANLAIAGVISEFEWCTSGKEQEIDIGNLLGVGELSVTNKSSKAHVAVDLRLIDVETGKILKTFKGQGRVDDSGFAINTDAFGVRLSKEAFEKTPLGQATRSAAADAATQIVAAIKKLN